MNAGPQDFELLKKFVRQGDQPAFATLVRRHLDLVYATALRKLSNEDAAEEIAQDVFVAFARKASRPRCREQPLPLSPEPPSPLHGAFEGHFARWQSSIRPASR